MSDPDDPDGLRPDKKAAPLTKNPEATQQREILINTFSNESFNDWYHEQQYIENILEGRAYFNGASPPPDPERHSPSKLLQCHRKVRYYAGNAPQEGDPPEGLFWVGTQFEENVIIPYLLEAVTTENTYVQNSIWIDTTIEVDGESLRLKGVTDPVIVDADATPILPSEVKTTSSLDYLNGPKRHHKAQLHAYLHALDKQYDRSIRDGMLVYGARDTLDIAAFHVRFDDQFWEETVLPWMLTQTRYRADDALPPADPAFDWECDMCPFQKRCGQANGPFADVRFTGLLPGVVDYRKQSLVEYFDAYPEAKLTPSLAGKYPVLADKYGVYEWTCRECSATVSMAESDQSSNNSPLCPQCAEQDVLSTLKCPLPEDQT